MEEPKRPNIWARLIRWLSKHHKVVLIVVGIIVIGAGAGATYLFLTNQPTVAKINKPVVKQITKVEPKPEPVVVKYYSPLTGLQVADDAATKLAVTGMMIENSPNARPQSGLKNSGVVFEAIAEGGITRFLVLYQQEKPQLIGPVRSIRLYDLDWIYPFNASVGHIGGSAAALREVRNGNYRDIDEFLNYSSYWRSTDRYAPHNVYTSFAKIDALNAAKGYTTSAFTGFSRINGKPSDTPNATNINIVISSSLYNSIYIYNKANNNYARSQAGEPHLDREDGQIVPTVVVAMRVDETTILEDGYRESIATIGSGNAVIFQNGIATNAIWHKDSKASQVTFTDSSGADIPLVRGQTWIVAVPNNGGDVSWS